MLTNRSTTRVIVSGRSPDLSPPHPLKQTNKNTRIHSLIPWVWGWFRELSKVTGREVSIYSISVKESTNIEVALNWLLKRASWGSSAVLLKPRVAGSWKMQRWLLSTPEFQTNRQTNKQNKNIYLSRRVPWLIRMKNARLLKTKVGWVLDKFISISMMGRPLYSNLIV